MFMWIFVAFIDAVNSIGLFFFLTILIGYIRNQLHECLLLSFYWNLLKNLKILSLQELLMLLVSSPNVYSSHLVSKCPSVGSSGFLPRCFLLNYFPVESSLLCNTRKWRYETRYQNHKSLCKNTDKETACTTKNTLTGGHIGDHGNHQGDAFLWFPPQVKHAFTIKETEKTFNIHKLSDI